MKKKITYERIIFEFMALAVLGFLMISCLQGLKQEKPSQKDLGDSSQLRLLKTIKLTAGARPEIVYANNRFYIIYNAPAKDGHGRCFMLKIYDKNFEKELASRVLVEASSSYGSPTDIRVTRDGEILYAVYEQANQQKDKSFLFVRKYRLDDNLTELAASPGPLVTGAFWYTAKTGDELLDDPASIVIDDSLYVMTKVRYDNPPKAVYRLRKISSDLSSVLEEYELDLSGIFNGPAQVNSLVSYRGKIYHIAPSLRSNRARGTKLLMVELNPENVYAPKGDVIVLSDRSRIEIGPKGAKFSQGFLFLAHEEVMGGVKPPRSQRPGPPKGQKMWLRVFDSKFREIASAQITRGEARGLHATIEMVGNKVYVAYGQSAGERGEGNIIVEIYLMRSLPVY